MKYLLIFKRDGKGKAVSCTDSERDTVLAIMAHEGYKLAGILGER